MRRAKKPVLLVANKTYNHELQYNAPEFYSLGLGDPYCISAVTGSGTGDMMWLIAGRVRAVKVTLKAGYKVLLVTKRQ